MCTQYYFSQFHPKVTDWGLGSHMFHICKGSVVADNLRCYIKFVYKIQVWPTWLKFSQKGRNVVVVSIGAFIIKITAKTESNAKTDWSWFLNTDLTRLCKANNAHWFELQLHNVYRITKVSLNELIEKSIDSAFPVYTKHTEHLSYVEILLTAAKQTIQCLLDTC